MGLNMTSRSSPNHEKWHAENKKEATWHHVNEAELLSKCFKYKDNEEFPMSFPEYILPKHQKEPIFF